MISSLTPMHKYATALSATIVGTERTYNAQLRSLINSTHLFKNVTTFNNIESAARHAKDSRLVELFFFTSCAESSKIQEFKDVAKTTISPEKRPGLILANRSDVEEVSDKEELILKGWDDLLPRPFSVDDTEKAIKNAIRLRKLSILERKIYLLRPLINQLMNEVDKHARKAKQSEGEASLPGRLLEYRSRIINIVGDDIGLYHSLASEILTRRLNNNYPASVKEYISKR